MTSVIPDDAPFEIDCPQCGKKISKTIVWFKGHGQTCPFCGCDLNFGDFGREIDKANQTIDDAWRKLGESFPKSA